MFKQRVAKPSANCGKNMARHIRYIATREGAVRNAQYIAYIAKRQGVIANKDMDFGLFGKYDGKNGTLTSLKDAMNYVKKKTEKGTHIYKTIISVKDEDAVKLELDTREGWEKAIKQNLHVIAKQMDIPLPRFEWMASVHMEKGHPHLHFDYWDKEQGVRDYFVTPQKANDIRQALTRAFFKEEMQPMFESRKNARDLVKDETLGILGRITAQMSADEYNNPSQQSDSEILHLRAVQKSFPRYALQLQELIDAIPKTGSLKQQYMPDDVKEKLRALSLDLISSNPQCQKAMENYLSSNNKIAQMYSYRSERWVEAQKKAEDYVYKEIENRILQAIRPMVLSKSQLQPDLLSLPTSSPSDDEIEKSEIDGKLIFEISLNTLRCVGKVNRDMQQMLHVRRGELSKQAKKEYALKNQNTSGIDWDDLDR